ncbi:hypothetical protein O9K51_04082 [Purpureocillium lavendulum]|uniref:Uncharacterized protein n=1 Tax=Purpureocillium lavendulum TaxID=1247861 RepID=A0AB34FUV0_9HYPO|nr:hypothetical protein O9K51_04082 [Purpureocillium lavendulum]
MGGVEQPSLHPDGSTRVGGDQSSEEEEKGLPQEATEPEAVVARPRAPDLESHGERTSISTERHTSRSIGRTPSTANTRSWREQRDRLRSRITSASKWYGTLQWQPCERHTKLADQVLSEIQMRSSDPSSRSIDKGRTILEMEGDVWIVTASQLYKARSKQLIKKLPAITKHEISDKNKGDLLVKTIALLQVLWLGLQLLARVTSKQPSTPLEIMTLSFAVCSFVIYLLLMKHPQDVMSPVYVEVDRACTAEDMKALAGVCPARFWGDWAIQHDNAIRNNAFHLLCPLRGSKCGIDKFDLCSDDDKKALYYLLGGAAFGGVVFGGVHLLAWDMEFPTDIEHILWKVSSIITMFAPASYGVLVFSYSYIRDRLEERRQEGWRHVSRAGKVGYYIVQSLGMLAFVLARVFLLVEALRSLYYLPRDAFVASWAANAPHVG